MEKVVCDAVQLPILFTDRESMQIPIWVEDSIECVLVLWFRNRRLIEVDVLAKEGLPLGPVSLDERCYRHNSVEESLLRRRTLRSCRSAALGKHVSQRVGRHAKLTPTLTKLFQASNSGCRRLCTVNMTMTY